MVDIFNLRNILTIERKDKCIPLLYFNKYGTRRSLTSILGKSNIYLEYEKFCANTIVFGRPAFLHKEGWFNAYGNLKLPIVE